MRTILLSLVLCCSTVAHADPVSAEERARLGQLYDRFAARISALMRESLAKKHRSQIGWSLDIAFISVPSSLPDMAFELRRLGFTLDRLRQIGAKDEKLLKEVGERYNKAIAPVVQEAQAAMAKLPEAEAQDCLDLVRRIFEVNLLSGPERAAIPALKMGLPRCAPLQPKGIDRCVRAQDLNEFDRCVLSLKR
jgi:hypothetical protein